MENAPVMLQFCKIFWSGMGRPPDFLTPPPSTEGPIVGNKRPLNKIDISLNMK